jgi:hypothetical protein
MRLSLRIPAFFALALSSSSLVACAMGASSLTPPPQKDSGADAAKTDAAPPTDAAKSDATPVPDADVPETIVPVCTLQQSLGSPSCDTCMEKSCCVETNSCLGSSQCMNFANCLSGCVDGDGGLDQTCANQCASSNPTGANLYADWSSCGDNFCRNQCFQ